MNNKQKIKSLIRKLNNDSITKEEYNAFIALVQVDDNKAVIQQAMDQEISDLNSGQKVISLQSSNRRRWIIGISAAASILLLVLAGIFLFGPTSSEQIRTYTTSYGETQEIVLPDNSRVKLNANSELTWLDSENNLREVRLSGEAFFNVQHMSGIPFRVYSDELTIQVLGTSFNVNNQNQRDKIFLEEGSVRVLYKKNENESVLLEPGEAAIYDESSTRIIKSTDRKFADQTAWKDGLLKFSNIPAQEILERLETLYGVDLVMTDPAALARPMDFIMPYSNWEVVSEGLALALGKRIVKKENQYEFVDK